MRIWRKVSIRFRAQVMTFSPYLLAIILGVCAALFLNGEQNFFEVQESRVETSVVEKSSEVSPGARTQIANIPSENVELRARELHETGTDSQESPVEDSSQAAPLAHEMTAEKDTALKLATDDPVFREELFAALNEGGFSESEIEDIFNELERAESTGDFESFHELIEQSIDTMMENLEDRLPEVEASRTEPSNQQEIEQITKEIEEMIREAGDSPEKLEAVEKKMEELTRLFDEHDQAEE